MNEADDLFQLSDLVQRQIPPSPWAEADNILWHDPGFSRRMLKEHLNPEHDKASRRPELIDEQVRWLHEEVLSGDQTRILDLGCGPGLYAIRLAKLGHDLTGVDVSPASLQYARKLASNAGLRCEFIDCDLRDLDLHGEYGLVMQIYGELNVFRRSEAAAIVRKSAGALSQSGILMLEVDTPETTRQLGRNPSVWSSYKSGLFSDQPYLLMQESFWDEHERAAAVRYWVVDVESGNVTRHGQTFAAYEADEYIDLLESVGLREVRLIEDYPSEPDGTGRRWMLTGTKRG